MYFDTRLSKTQIATDEEVATKQAHILSGSPLRLAFAGRLERMKGADDLIRIAAELDRRGKDFRLKIYGAGSLEADMRRELNNSTTMGSLREKVKIFAPIDFDHELVPTMRSEIDLFLCCHRQADPSCTYLETLGCAVPILGYNNDAWRGILDLADVGWRVEIDKPNDMVGKLIDLDANRLKLATVIHRAREFGAAHSFEIEFEKRVSQLRRLAKVS
jgi:glycosyltransferase involved in cell wall biosynthesis